MNLGPKLPMGWVVGLSLALFVCVYGATPSLSPLSSLEQTCKNIYLAFIFPPPFVQSHTILISHATHVSLTCRSFASLLSPLFSFLKKYI